MTRPSIHHAEYITKSATHRYAEGASTTARNRLPRHASLQTAAIYARVTDDRKRGSENQCQTTAFPDSNCKRLVTPAASPCRR